MPGLVLGSPVVLPGLFGQPTSGEIGKQTLADLRAKLLKQLGSRDDVSTADLNGYINDAMSEISSEIMFDELRGTIQFVTTIGVNQYLLPSGVNTLIDCTAQSGLFYFTNRILKKTDRQAYDRYPDVQSWPVMFFREGKTLVLWPTPNDTVTITVTFTTKPQKLVADTDQIILDSQWEVPLLLRARAIALSSLGDPDLGSQAMNEYLASARSKISKIGEERAGTISSIMIPRRKAHIYRGFDSDGDDW